MASSFGAIIVIEGYAPFTLRVNGQKIAIY